MSRKREDYLSWKDYFMSLAFLAAKRSKDPNTQVGACIVTKTNQIVSIGYNGFPIIPPDWSRPNQSNDDKFPWDKDNEDYSKTKYMYVCHAAMNAIVFKNTADVKGCTMYLSLFPTNECAKIIIQSGIQEVVYLSNKYIDKPETQAAKKMLEAAKVRLVQFKPEKKTINIDFREIDMAPMNLG